MTDIPNWPILWGVPEAYTAFLLRRRLGEHDGPLIHVARDDAAVAALADMLAYVEPDVTVLRFPAWDCLPYDRVSPNPAITAERAATLTRLLEPSGKTRRIVLTTVHALVQRVPPRDAFRNQAIAVRKGEALDQAMLIELLVASGYTRTDTVMEAGEFATRGGIFDLYPAGESEPIRLDLFGDEVDNIRRFDVASQRSTETLDAFKLRPVSEYALSPDAISRFRSSWRDLFGPSSASDVVYEHVSEGRRFPGLEHYIPLFHEHMDTLIDYLPEASVSIDHQVPDILKARLEMIADHFEARKAPAREARPFIAPCRLICFISTARAGTPCWRACLHRAQSFCQARCHAGP